ncbi:sigma-54 dependent transcriptional regulator [Halobacteriovorax sp. HLS]|uniref:sigma-54-dependent transcriptional regulator n=1 Tax=Halobacteriovorax sp. HLS TaxID=2234000 RepID=UPI000FDB5BF3|nr:sigma 54-interacting transcriptional regulator [Halobacteriovorax sp. HLS]
MRLNQDLEDSQLFYSKLLIRPLYGKSQKVTLNRTKYEIHSNFDGDTSLSGTQFLLPSFKNESLEFELVLNQQVHGQFYILNSLNKIPFKLNGNLVFSAIITQGDKVDLGHNRLEFDYIRYKEKKHFKMAAQIVRSNLPVLIEGETGVGKSYLAKEIHRRSERVGPFVHLNLSSFSANLLESELFGHIKGAFTGAINEKVGAIEQASSGTLFLDEIDSVSLELQTKLLLFLDSNSFRKVGSNEDKFVDIRIIFASGQNLNSLVEMRRFRKDMYYRIACGEVIRLSPLREDVNKIKEVIKDFELEKDCVVSIRLEKFLCSFSWPGNIRQLRGHLEKKRVLSSGRRLDYDFIDEQLLGEIVTAEGGTYNSMNYKDVKASYFSNIVSKCHGDIKIAAQTLGVSVNTVKNVLKTAA